MKYSIILLLSLVLIAGISAPAYSQTITDHIVINEVDTNPPGDDAESISEWVELYNPTDDDVDLSGWKILKMTMLLGNEPMMVFLIGNLRPLLLAFLMEN